MVPENCKIKKRPLMLLVKVAPLEYSVIYTGMIGELHGQMYGSIYRIIFIGIEYLPSQWCGI